MLLNVMGWSLLASSRNVNIRMFIVVGMAIVLVSHILSLVLDEKLLMVISNLFLAAMLLPAMTSMTRYLMSREEANVHTISASACIYILMALFWATLYALVVYVDPEAFSVSPNLLSHFSEGGDLERFRSTCITVW